MAGAIRQRKQATSSGQPFAQLNFISHNMQLIIIMYMHMTSRNTLQEITHFII